MRLTGEELVREARGSDASGGAGDDFKGVCIVQVVGDEDAFVTSSLLHTCQQGDMSVSGLAIKTLL